MTFWRRNLEMSSSVDASGENKMNDSQLKARTTRLNNHLQNNELLTTYERQTIKKKKLYDNRKRIT